MMAGGCRNGHYMWAKKEGEAPRALGECLLLPHPTGDVSTHVASEQGKVAGILFQNEKNRNNPCVWGSRVPSP